MMFTSNPDFYPTPRTLAEKMLAKVDFTRVASVLEPSAGKGDLVDALRNTISKFRASGQYDAEVDCVENDVTLAKLLESKEENVTLCNFLEFETFKRYDLILMNPPFSAGDKHLLKALELVKNGGQVVCLLNAETLRNPYSVTRKDLVRKLEEYEADVEYVQNAFCMAERKTDVEIAVVYVDVPAIQPLSLILDDLEESAGYHVDFNNETNITFYDVIQRMVQQYKYEAKLGIKLIEEYCNLKPYVMDNLKKDPYSKPLLCLLAAGKEIRNVNQAINKYMEKLRYKYWYALGNDPAMNEKLTTNLREVYHDKLQDLKHKEFNVRNIELVNDELMAMMNIAVEDTILKLFDELSYQHHYHDEYSKNIHYYNGWKTNKAHYINSKVIVPFLNCTDWCGTEIYMTKYEVVQKLSDIEKTLDYLSNGMCGKHPSVQIILQQANNIRQTKKIRMKYFDVDFFKKGTVHIKFLYPELLKKLNIFGSQKKGWLPPNYGKKHFRDMSTEEQDVIKEFDGSEVNYEQVVANQQFYALEANNVLRLNSCN